MSVVITLVPLALAAAGLLGGGGIAAAATIAGSGTGSTPSPGRAVTVQTRMKDLGLLEQALADIGATTVEVGDDTVHAEIDGLEVEMTRDADGVWQSRFSGAGHSDDALRLSGGDIIGRLDAAYAARVQEAVADRIRERAGDAGFELTEESRDADALRMVLTVRDGS